MARSVAVFLLVHPGNCGAVSESHNQLGINLDLAALAHNLPDQVGMTATRWHEIEHKDDAGGCSKRVSNIRLSPR